MSMISRRRLLTSLVSFAAASPAIVRAASIMPVRAIPRDVIYVNRTIRTAADLFRMQEENLFLEDMTQRLATLRMYRTTWFEGWNSLAREFVRQDL